jgi:hypothetical protein
MKTSLIALAVLSFAASASATFCPDGSTIESHPGGNCSAGTPGSSSSSSAGGGGGGGGGAGIGVGISGAQSSAAAQSAALAAGGNAQALGGAGGVGLGGSAAQRQQQQQGQSLTNQNQNSSGVVIQGNQAGSGDRTSYNATAWAPVIHGPAAPALASGNLVVVPGVCGPRVRVITTQVVGQHYGAMGGQTDTPNGYTETLGEYLDEYGYPAEPFVQRGGYLIGHQVTQYAAILGTSSAASFSVGGFVDSKGLQGGAAGSGARQQLVKGLQVSECIVPVAPPPPPPAVIVTPPPAPRVVYRTRYRDRPVKPACCCTAVLAPSCTIGSIK